MKRSIFIICLLVFSQLQGQTGTESQLLLISKKIVNQNQSDSLNLVSIFNWITDNIEYDVKTYQQNLDYPYFIIDPNLDSASYMKVYNSKVSEMVIRTKKAICDGYSRLFLSLCELAKIQCKYITGKVRFPLRDELAEHAWNAVLINNQWYLLDITWASGYVSRNSFVEKRKTFSSI
ncbi:MAG: transglutaminase domain-containing protein [Ekhidna sp.]